MKKLRNYQQDCINDLFAYWKNSDKALAVLSCAAGKTFIFASMVKIILKHNPRFRCLFVVDSNILIEQTAKELDLDYGIYNAGMKQKDLTKPITICSVQSIVNAPASTFDLIVIDEVHEFSINNEDSRIRKFLDNYKESKALGLTATPFDKNGFIYGENHFFKNVAYQKDMKDLTEEGFLSPVVLTESTTHKYNTDNLRVRNGDFLNKDLISLVNNDKNLVERVKNVIEKTRQRKKVVVVCVSIEHAEDVAEVFRVLGYGCVSLHSKTDKNNIKLFEDGDIKYLTSVMMLKKGYDYPALDCIALFRPVRSPALYVQIVGRVARKSKGKDNGLFLDYGGVVDALGNHYSPLVKGNVPSRMELCPECETFQPLGTMTCSCGFVLKVFPPNQTRVERDLFKNLTIVAGGVIWHKVTKIKATDYKSKAGNLCIKVAFCRGMFDPYFVNEYFSEKNMWKMKSFLNINFGISETPDTLADFKKIINESQGPNEILVTKHNGFNKIIGRKFI